MELEDETRLVARLLSGDNGALDEFVLAYRRFVIAVFSRRQNLHPDDVEELYQRFLLHIWENGYRRLRGWRGNRSLRAYLGTVARNLARDYGRERRRGSDNVDTCLWATTRAEDPCDRDRDRVRMLQSALTELSARDRCLIHRRYYMEESYREIADGLGMTVNHVGVALLRAESRLKIIFQKKYEEL